MAETTAKKLEEARANGLKSNYQSSKRGRGNYLLSQYYQVIQLLTMQGVHYAKTA